MAEQGGFRRAAQRLYLAQPTVTAHVQALEREVGAALFERGGRAVRLTAAGERLLPFATRILGLEADALREVSAWRLRYDERLRLACSIFVAASALPRALRLLLGERPRLDLSLRTGFSAEVLQAVRAGDADLGLSRLPPEPEGLGGRRLLAEPVLAVAPAAWGPVGLADALAAHPLLTHNHPGYWDRLLAQLQALGLRLQPMPVRQVDVTCRLVREGLGLSFLPRSAVAGVPDLQVLQPVPGLELPQAGTWAVWPAGSGLPRAGERLIALLAEDAPPAMRALTGGPAGPAARTGRQRPVPSDP